MRWILKLAVLLHRFILRRLGASTVGVRALVVDSQGRLLLVRHTYQEGWYLPGGGVLPGETTEAAIARELREEVGITPRGRPELFGVYFHEYMGVNDYPVVYVVNDFEQSAARSPEIAEARWFVPGALPPDVTSGTRKRALELFDGTSKVPAW